MTIFILVYIIPGLIAFYLGNETYRKKIDPNHPILQQGDRPTEIFEQLVERLGRTDKVDPAVDSLNFKMLMMATFIPLFQFVYIYAIYQFFLATFD